MNVLLAEDNLVNQRLAAEILRRRGHSVVAVDNGRKVLEAVELEPFDALLMDVQMPEMDGLEATAEIRRREQQAADGHRLPIIAVTAHAMPGDRQQCLEAGMDAYVPKPINVSELLAAIASAVSACGRRWRGRDDQDATAARRPPAAFGQVAALECAAGDRALLCEVLGLVVDCWPADRRRLEQAYRESRLDVVARAAHSFGGAMGNIAAREALDRAVRLERAALKNDPGAAGEALSRLCQAMDELIPDLQRFIGPGQSGCGGGETA
jgi:CheY-like chemotaxis protein/HPt (histidine-containing phosphotransfer) domain-containing protein